MKLRRCGDCPSDVDLELLDRLRSWRGAEASKQHVPAYVIFTDATLTAIAEHRPADGAGLVGIPGIGARKLERYGAAVLALIDRRRNAAEKVLRNSVVRPRPEPLLSYGDGLTSPSFATTSPGEEVPDDHDDLRRCDHRHPSAQRVRGAVGAAEREALVAAVPARRSSAAS